MIIFLSIIVAFRGSKADQRALMRSRLSPLLQFNESVPSIFGIARYPIYYA